MAVSTLNNARSQGKPSYQGLWTRPSEWLTLPTLTAGDQKVVALVHLHVAERNAVAFSLAGAYTVDWGDGTTANYATGVKAEHTYTYATTSASTQTSDGYRQVILTVTPQVGQTLSSLSFTQSPTGYSSGYIQPFRDIAVVGSAIATFTFSTDTIRNGARWFNFVGPSGVTVLGDCFRAAPQLRGLSGTQWTSNVTTMNQAFVNCPALQMLPLLDTSLVSNMDRMFQNCTNLRSVPLFDTSKVVSAAQLFQNCPLLSSVPAFDLSKATNLNSMFNGCYTLATVPALNTPLCTNFSTMFLNCIALRTAPSLDTSSATTMSGMFSGCASLTSVPLYSTTKVTDFGSMFLGCTLLSAIPAFDTSVGITFSNMFQNCTSVESVSLNTVKATGVGLMFFTCPGLRSLTLDLSGIASSAAASQVLGTTPALVSLVWTGLRFAPNGLGLTSLGLSAAALNALYTSLGTASGAQTLTVTGNPGSGSSTPSIATAKGWTIVGG